MRARLSYNWKGETFAGMDHIMGMLLDSEIHNDISSELFSDNYLRVNSSLGKVNRFLDDDSEENLERIHLMGLEWWSEFGKPTIKFINS